MMTLGDGAEMDAISAVVLGGTSMNGGRGTIAGTVIGAIVIGVLKNGMNLLGIDSSWQYIVQGIENSDCSLILTGLNRPDSNFPEK